MKIDLVYLWCDGSDPTWREKRDSYIDKVSEKSDNVTFCAGRIADNNDLLYSLRSVEMYAPWINHIYIVTGNQCPDWLDVSNDKITVINQNDLLPKDAIPSFNSCAIEHVIHKIEGLSEHYIYANDDMMFGRKVTPDFFFTPDGRAKCRFVKPATRIVSNGTYELTIDAAINAIVKDFGKEYDNLYPHHQIDAYIKSSVYECVDRYSDWHNLTLGNRFRSPLDMQRHIFSLYIVAVGKGTMRVFNKESIFKKLLKLVKISLGLTKGIDYLMFSLGAYRFSFQNVMLRVKLFKPALLCFNDGPRACDSDRIILKTLYQKLFPLKSQFEK